MHTNTHRKTYSLEYAYTLPKTLTFSIYYQQKRRNNGTCSNNWKPPPSGLFFSFTKYISLPCTWTWHSSFFSITPFVFLLITHHSLSHCWVRLCVCVRACVQPPLGRAFFSFQYDIDFLYDFIRLIPALPPCTHTRRLPLSLSLTHIDTQMPIMPAFPPSNQSKRLVFGSMASMSRLEHWKWKNGPFRKPEHIA